MSAQLSSQDYLGRILRSRVREVAVETPLQPAPLVSRRLKNKVLLKREGLQPVFSFKLRGAFHKMHSLSSQEKQQGVVAASAGNHAQGVALAGQALGIDAVIVMPTTTPGIKVNAVRSLGAECILHGDGFDEACTYALQLAQEQERIFIHPYDDPDVIAGQATVAVEILQQCPENTDAIFVPVGGGGLLAGVALYVKQLFPQIKVIGVEPEDSACMHAALQAGKPVQLDNVNLFADGVAVRKAGTETFRLAQQYVDDVILVSTDEICAAIKDIFEDTRSIAEPAGALAMAGLTKYARGPDVQEQTLIAIESGANTDFNRLRFISERTSTGAHSEVLLGVTIPETPGSFLRFCQMLMPRLVTEFNYRYADSKQAKVFVGLKLAGGDQERQQLIAELRSQDYPVLDMTDNELAKLHIRHMVGGPVRGVADERVFRFNFPERPGALISFLEEVGGRWNISLFHYRNHGAAYGRVLVGLQVPPEQSEEFSNFRLAMHCHRDDETKNPAYALFLQACAD